MSPRIRVKGATIVSMDPTLGIIEAGDLLIDDGKIVAVGRNVGSWAVIEIDGRGMIAMPGFINGHIHLWQTALRGIAADWTLDHYFSVLIGQVVGLYTPQDAYIGNLVGALDHGREHSGTADGPDGRPVPNISSSDIARPGKAAGKRWAGNGPYSRPRRVSLENFH